MNTIQCIDPVVKTCYRVVQSIVDCSSHLVEEYPIPQHYLTVPAEFDPTLLPAQLKTVLKNYAPRDTANKATLTHAFGEYLKRILAVETVAEIETIAASSTPEFEEKRKQLIYELYVRRYGNMPPEYGEVRVITTSYHSSTDDGETICLLAHALLGHLPTSTVKLLFSILPKGGYTHWSMKSLGPHITTNDGHGAIKPRGLIRLAAMATWATAIKPPPIALLGAFLFALEKNGDLHDAISQDGPDAVYRLCGTSLTAVPFLNLLLHHGMAPKNSRLLEFLCKVPNRFHLVHGLLQAIPDVSVTWTPPTTAIIECINNYEVDADRDIATEHRARMLLTILKGGVRDGEGLRVWDSKSTLRCTELSPEDLEYYDESERRFVVKKIVAFAVFTELALLKYGVVSFGNAYRQFELIKKWIDACPEKKRKHEAVGDGGGGRGGGGRGRGRSKRGKR